MARGVSQAEHSVESAVNEDMFPITQPIKKLEGQIQCTGEAEYVDDIAPEPTELFAAYVLSKKGACDYDTVDASQALVGVFILVKCRPI